MECAPLSAFFRRFGGGGGGEGGGGGGAASALAAVLANGCLRPVERVVVRLTEGAGLGVENSSTGGLGEGWGLGEAANSSGEEAASSGGRPGEGWGRGEGVKSSGPGPGEGGDCSGPGLGEGAASSGEGEGELRGGLGGDGEGNSGGAGGSGSSSGGEAGAVSGAGAAGEVVEGAGAGPSVPAACGGRPRGAGPAWVLLRVLAEQRRQRMAFGACGDKTSSPWLMTKHRTSRTSKWRDAYHQRAASAALQAQGWGIPSAGEALPAIRRCPRVRATAKPVAAASWAQGWAQLQAPQAPAPGRGFGWPRGRGRARALHGARWAKQRQHG